jgi:hypothetical protein
MRECFIQLHSYHLNVRCTHCSIRASRTTKMAASILHLVPYEHWSMGLYYWFIRPYYWLISNEHWRTPVVSTVRCLRRTLKLHSRRTRNQSAIYGDILYLNPFSCSLLWHAKYGYGRYMSLHTATVTLGLTTLKC